MHRTIDLSRTREQLEGEIWGDPEVDSYTVTTCHRLRRVPLRDLANQDLRILIGQNIGLPFLIPLAIDRLCKDIFLESEFYAGDLLNHVLSVEPGFWRKNAQLQRAIEELAAVARKRLPELAGDAHREVATALRQFTAGGRAL